MDKGQPPTDEKPSADIQKSRQQVLHQNAVAEQAKCRAHFLLKHPAWIVCAVCGASLEGRRAAAVTCSRTRRVKKYKLD